MLFLNKTAVYFLLNFETYRLCSDYFGQCLRNLTRFFPVMLFIGIVYCNTFIPRDLYLQYATHLMTDGVHLICPTSLQTDARVHTYSSVTPKTNAIPKNSWYFVFNSTVEGKLSSTRAVFWTGKILIEIKLIITNTITFHTVYFINRFCKLSDK